MKNRRANNEKHQERSGPQQKRAIGSCRHLTPLGELYADAERTAEACENLKKAERMFREMEMDYWLGKAQEVLAAQ